MCDCYVPTVGYICYECIKEFKEKTGRVDSFGQLHIKLVSFMDSYKADEFLGVDMDEFFDKYTR
jgi:hypothetical protein